MAGLTWQMLRNMHLDAFEQLRLPSCISARDTSSVMDQDYLRHWIGASGQSPQNCKHECQEHIIVLLDGINLVVPQDDNEMTGLARTGTNPK